MIIVRHTEECTGAPNLRGELTGQCNCKTAKLDERARKHIAQLLGTLAEESIKAGEGSEYFALRLDAIAAEVIQGARGVRLTAKRSDRTTRNTTMHTKRKAG